MNRNLINLNECLMFCDTCGKPTQHEYCDPDIQCKICHSIKAAIHPMIADKEPKQVSPMSQNTAQHRMPTLIESILNQREHLAKLEMLRELELASEPLVNFLRKHFNPHCKVIVEVNRVEVIQGELSTPLSF